MNPFLGQIIMFGGNFAPRGWAFCHGQLLAISGNSALFSILGTIYGGDGRTTFALPDLRGRVAISEGRGPGLPDYRLGSRSGQSSVVLNVLELPSHTHAATGTVAGSVTVGTSSGGPDTTSSDGVLCNTPTPTNYNEETANQALGGVSHNLTPNVTIQNQGGSQAHNNMQPYLAVNYIIAMQGTYPSRN